MVSGRHQTLNYFFFSSFFLKVLVIFKNLKNILGSICSEVLIFPPWAFGIYRSNGQLHTKGVSSANYTLLIQGICWAPLQWPSLASRHHWCSWECPVITNWVPIVKLLWMMQNKIKWFHSNSQRIPCTLRTWLKLLLFFPFLSFFRYGT